MRQLEGMIRAAWWVATAVGIAFPAAAQTTTDQPAALLSFPHVVVDSAGGTDTIIQLSVVERPPPAPVGGPESVHCVFAHATGHGHCTNLPALACSNDADCFGGGICAPAWAISDFEVDLTWLQPIAWRAGQGLAQLPCTEPVQFCQDGGVNHGSIPPVQEDPFVGNLRCWAIDPSTRQPIGENILKGSATIERYQTTGGPSIDVAEYNGIGNAAVGANDGDDRLVIGGPAAEYDGCPVVNVVSHFFDGATDPVSQSDTIFTNLTTVPCALDTVFGVPPVVTLQFLVFNEFEQRFSTSTLVTGQRTGRLSSIDSPDPAQSLFNFNVAGTLTGQTRIHGVQGGIMAVAIEEHDDPTQLHAPMTAAFNTHVAGERTDPEAVGRPFPVCGNGFLEAGETCDDGNLIDCDGCSSTCKLPACGDGIVCAPEQCDDGNTVSGDGCSATCQSELIPGGGRLKSDCAHKWLTSPLTPLNRSGVPASRLACADGDPTCDFGASGDGACTFHVALCFNATDQAGACTPTDVALLQLNAPNESQPANPVDSANRDALEGALAGEGGVIRGRCTQPRAKQGQLCATNPDCDSAPGTGNGKCGGRLTAFIPPLATTNTCTAFAAVTVPLQAHGTKRGMKTLRVTATPSNDPSTGRPRTSDIDSLTLVCKP